MIIILLILVYPSHIRSTALGLCSFFARIGGIAMPFVAQTLGDKHLNIALSIFSGIYIFRIILNIFYFIFLNTYFINYSFSLF